MNAPEPAIPIGFDALTDSDLLCIVLGATRRRPRMSALAADILAQVGGVHGLARAGPAVLSADPRVGPAGTTRVMAALELGRRAHADPPPRIVQSGADVWRWARLHLTLLDHEELWILCLDGRSGLRSARRVAMGGLHGLHVAARDPLRHALRDGASVFVLVHNHPSDDPTPSQEDVSFTVRVAEASAVVGVPLVDHVVVARSGYRSLADLGMLPILGEHPPGVDGDEVA